jgi:hypothetical protein
MCTGGGCVSPTLSPSQLSRPKLAGIPRNAETNVAHRRGHRLPVWLRPSPKRQRHRDHLGTHGYGRGWDSRSAIRVEVARQIGETPGQ